MKTRINLILSICKVGLNKCKPLFRMSRSPQSLLWRAVIIFVGLFFIITLAVGGFIYIKGARGNFVEFWAKGVPYPAGLVKWKIITYADYLQDLDALEHFYSRQQETAGLPAPEEKVLEKAVMDRMVRNIAVGKLARARGVWVKQDELKAEFQSTVSQVGTEEEAELLLKDLYGWNSRTFIDRVLKYFVLEEKLLSEFGGSAELEGAIAAEIAKLSAIRFFGK